MWLPALYAVRSHEATAANPAELPAADAAGPALIAPEDAAPLIIAPAPANGFSSTDPAPLASPWLSPTDRAAPARLEPIGIRPLPLPRGMAGEAVARPLSAEMENPLRRLPEPQAMPAPTEPRVATAPPSELPASQGTSLMQLDSPPARSPQLEMAAEQADRLARHGYDLANRRAYFAARAEFIGALRVLAQGLDAERHNTVHSEALSAGLTAMDEAADFLPGHGGLEADVNVSRLVANHRTTILHGVDCAALTPLAALKHYFTYAQEQLAVAAEREVAGSIALQALGKLYATLSREPTIGIVAAEPRAVAFFQASLLVMPDNFMAANDFGVFLARSGEYIAARRVLEHSLTLQPQADGWHNLAVVYQQLGMIEPSQRAAAQSVALRHAKAAGTQIATGPYGVAWVDPQTFAQVGGQNLQATMSEGETPRTDRRTAARPAAGTKNTTPPTKRK